MQMHGGHERMTGGRGELGSGALAPYLRATGQWAVSTQPNGATPHARRTGAHGHKRDEGCHGDHKRHGHRHTQGARPLNTPHAA